MTRTPTSPARSRAARKADALDRLEHETDVWVATGDESGRPHLVPLSLCWDGERIIVRVKETSRTARNAITSSRARLALGETRDVVVIDAVADWVPADQAPEIAALYEVRTGSDPRGGAAGCVFLLLSPVRMQAWREVEEMSDRTLMQGGRWAT